MKQIAQYKELAEDWAVDRNPEVLTKIYGDAISIAMWQRQLQADVQSYLSALLLKPKVVAVNLSGTPEQLMEEIKQVFPAQVGEGNTRTSAAALYTDIHQILDMFACLFDANTLGLRVNTLDHAMCPRFHTDNVAIRLITTYYGLATEWLPNAVVNRNALGTSFASQVNTPGAIIETEEYIQRMGTSDVALLKGELWDGNEGRGIVHRSPALTSQQPKRLVMTCDLID